VEWVGKWKEKGCSWKCRQVHGDQVSCHGKQHSASGVEGGPLWRWRAGLMGGECRWPAGLGLVLTETCNVYMVHRVYKNVGMFSQELSKQVFYRKT